MFTIVNISKAFDTILHSVLRPCHAKKGISAPLTEIILEMYKGCKTVIKTSDSKGVEVDILTGVKQGDPLSPLLINLFIGPLLEIIEKETSGIKVTDQKRLSVLAFADDIVLLGDDELEAQRQLDTLHWYLSNLGMKISEEKNQSFQVVAKRDTWFVKDPEIKLNNDN